MVNEDITQQNSHIQMLDYCLNAPIDSNGEYARLWLGSHFLDNKFKQKIAVELSLANNNNFLLFFHEKKRHRVQQVTN